MDQEMAKAANRPGVGRRDAMAPGYIMMMKLENDKGQEVGYRCYLTTSREMENSKFEVFNFPFFSLRVVLFHLSN